MKQESGRFPEAGARFPDFQLPGDDGREYTLSSLLAKAPAALIAVFKTDCPTSQFSLPYLNSLREHIPELPFIGISQDDTADTAEFIERWGARFSRILYEEEPYLLSDALVITNVPSLFLVAAEGRILASDFGYSGEFWEMLAQKAAAAFGAAVRPILPPDAPRWALG